MNDLYLIVAFLLLCVGLIARIRAAELNCSHELQKAEQFIASGGTSVLR